METTAHKSHSLWGLCNAICPVSSLAQQSNGKGQGQSSLGSGRVWVHTGISDEAEGGKAWILRHLWSSCHARCGEEHGPHSRHPSSTLGTTSDRRKHSTSESHSVTQHSQNTCSPPCLPSSSSCPVSFTHACAHTHTHTPSWCQVSIRFPSISRSLDCPDLQRRSYTQSTSFNSRSMRVITMCVCVCV